MKTASYLRLVMAVCVVVMAPQSASAQCTYRLIDVGRPMGYLGGPCNGHALGYAGAYPAYPNAAAQANPTVYAPRVKRQAPAQGRGAR